MSLVKKLLFAPFYLCALAFTLIQSLLFFKNPSSTFSLDPSVITSLILLSLGIVLSGFFFILFASLANDLKITLPVVLLSSVLGVIFLPGTAGYVFLGALFLAGVVVSFSLSQALKSYLNFQPTSLFAPQMKNFGKFLCLILAVSLFIAAKEANITTFQVPDSIINAAIQATPGASQADFGGVTQQAPLPSIDPSQLALLKQNPALLKQYGITSEELDQLSSSGGNPQALLQSPSIKDQVKQEVQSMIAPYSQFIPLFLALALFITISSVSAFASLLLYPLIGITFSILERTGFIEFRTEQREIKKMVV